MKRRWLIFAVTIVVVYIVVGRGLGIKHQIGNELQLDLFRGNTTFYFDNHDYLLHNDGATVMVMKFSGQAAEYMQTQLANSLTWEAIPLPKQLQSEIYGRGCHTWATPSTFAEMAKVPQIQNGYWFFVDQTAYRKGTPRYGSKAVEGLKAREPETIQAGYPGWEMPGKYALALYDLDTGTLYYFQRNL